MRYVLTMILLLITAPIGHASEAVDAWTEANFDSLVKLYIHLHTHPELSFQEEATAAKIAEEWRLAGYDVTTGVGGHGLVGILKNGDGPTVMLRTDLDALPVTE